MNSLGSVSLVTVLLAAMSVPCAAGGVRVLRSDSRALELEWTSDHLDLVSTPGNGGPRRRPVAQGSMSLADVGEPDLPSLVRLVGIPPHGTPRLNVVSVTAEVEPLPDIAIVSPEQVGAEAAPTAAQDLVKGLFPRGWARLEGDLFVRGQRMTRIILDPWRYDSSRGELSWATRLHVRIEFDGAWPRIARTADALDWEAAMDSALLNAEVARGWRSSRPRRSLYGGEDSFDSSPNWLRAAIDVGGVYAIDYFTFTNAGIDPALIDPTSIRVFSGTNLPLTEEYSTPPPSFMTECALLDLGNQDAIFDVGDRLLFYALTPHGWASEYDPARSRVEHVENQHTDASAYWITWGGTFGRSPKRMINRSVAPGVAPPATSAPHRVHFEENNVPDFRFRDEDGWFWESLRGRGTDRGYSLDLDRVASGDGTLTARIGSFGWTDSDLFRGFELKVAGVVVAETSWMHGRNTALVDVVSVPFQGLLKEGTNTIQVNVDTTTPESNDFLYTAWFAIEYARELTTTGGYVKFFSEPAASHYELGGFDADDVYLFDVSDQHEVVRLTDFELTEPSETRSVRFSDPGGVRDTWYVGVSASGVRTLPTPEVREIRGLRHPGNAADYVVLYHPSLEVGGQRLAALRRSVREPRSSVLAASLAEVYDEFSWGMKDPVAIRDFLAYAVAEWNVPPLYVALLGDAAYDTKGNLPESPENQLSSYVNRYRTEATVQYDDSLNLNFYSTDDYFGYLEPEDYAAGGEPALDVAIGRFPSATPAELDILLDKLESYLNHEAPGSWQNRIVLAADDERTPSGFHETIHTIQVESLATEWLPPALNKVKVYLTEYPLDAYGKKPEAQAAFIDEFTRGALFVSYTGHGDRNTLAQEEVFVSKRVPELLNENRYPIFSTFSCTVSRFDEIYGLSMTERLLFHPSGGAVATFSSGGLVFSTTSFNLHKSWLAEIFGTPYAGETYARPLRPLGVAAMVAKSITGVYGSFRRNNEKYNLLGDPALVPRYARYFAGFDQLTVETDTVERSMRTIRGHVTDETGRVLDGTNGTVSFDGTAFVYVTSNADTSGYTFDQGHIDYVLDGTPLYEGESPVRGGRFTARFVIPESVDPGIRGRIGVFAIEEGAAERRAAGAYDRLSVAPTIQAAAAPKGRK